MSSIARHSALHPRACLVALLVVSAVAGFSAEATKRAGPPLPLWLSAPETQALLDRRKAVSRRLMAASKAEDQEPNAYHLAKLNTREAIQRRRELLEAYRDAWNQWSEEIRDEESKLRGALEQQGVALARIDKIMDNFRQTRALTGKLTAGLPEGPRQERHFTLMRELLDLAEANLGRWQIDANGNVVITAADFRKKYLELAGRMQEFAAEGESRTAAIEARAEAARERLSKKNAGTSEASPLPSPSKR